MAGWAGGRNAGRQAGRRGACEQQRLLVWERARHQTAASCCDKAARGGADTHRRPTHTWNSRPLTITRSPTVSCPAATPCSRGAAAEDVLATGYCWLPHCRVARVLRLACCASMPDTPPPAQPQASSSPTQPPRHAPPSQPCRHPHSPPAPPHPHPHPPRLACMPSSMAADRVAEKMRFCPKLSADRLCCVSMAARS